MRSVLQRESPLSQCDFSQRPLGRDGEAGVSLLERAFCGHFNLRGDPKDADFRGVVQRATGVALPLRANTVSQDEQMTALWLGPDEWLLVTPPDQAIELKTRLGDALEGTFSALNDIGGGQTIICVSGAKASEALAKGCTLDLHPRAFGPGQCAQTHLAKAIVVIRPLASNLLAYDVVVRRSFADYLWRWLEDAAAEYGLARTRVQFLG